MSLEKIRKAVTQLRLKGVNPELNDGLIRDRSCNIGTKMKMGRMRSGNKGATAGTHLLGWVEEGWSPLKGLISNAVGMEASARI